MNDDATQSGEEDHAEEDQDDQESEYSESSDEGAVDANVQRDMERLQDSYPGFRQKYRLIKRIGEGTHRQFAQDPNSLQSDCRQAPSPQSTKQKISNTTHSIMPGTSRKRTTNGQPRL